VVALDNDTVGAFVLHGRAMCMPLAEGGLSGLTFAVKDLYDVAGALTTYGHPEWAKTHSPAASTAPVIQGLLQAGAWLIGKTKTVELAFGLTGENVWQGTPRNPRAPDRFPGGSSCGSAAAVAAGLVDFALGSDTGGSVRIPASYCGLFGIRPTFGAISLAGARALAPSLDTCGWFSPNAGILARVGETLLPGGGEGVAGPLLRAEEAWVNAEPEVATALHPALEKLGRRFGRALSIQLAPEGLDTFYDHFRSIQAEEVWATLGGWVTANNPTFGPGVAERFATAASLDPALPVAGRAFRRMVQTRIRPLLSGGAVLVYPTSPCPAPLLTASPEEQDAVREATIGVTSIAGFCGLPEVTLPVATVGGAPVGLSLVAGPGRDCGLLSFVQEAAAVLGLPV
jgi:amidase